MVAAVQNKLITLGITVHSKHLNIVTTLKNPLCRYWGLQVCAVGGPLTYIQQFNKEFNCSMFSSTTWQHIIYIQVIQDS